MINIPFDNVGDWLKTSEKYLCYTQLKKEEENNELDWSFDVPNDCYIHSLSNIKLNDLILIYNSTVWWNTNIPQEFYDYCISNKNASIEVFEKIFPQKFNEKYIPMLNKMNNIKLFFNCIETTNGTYIKKICCKGLTHKCTFKTKLLFTFGFCVDTFSIIFDSCSIFLGNSTVIYFNFSEKHILLKINTLIRNINIFIDNLKQLIPTELKFNTNFHFLFKDDVLIYGKQSVNVNEFNIYHIIKTFENFKNVLLYNLK